MTSERDEIDVAAAQLSAAKISTPGESNTPAFGSPQMSPQRSAGLDNVSKPSRPQFHSPQRARGPSAPTVGQSHASAQGKPGWGLQDASSTLFGLFGRRPSVASMSNGSRPQVGSSRASVSDSVFGGLDRMAAPAQLATPTEARRAGDLAATALEDARTYSAALDAASAAAAQFGASLDACSRTKPADKSIAGLQQAGGFHLLVSNHLHILRSSLDERFAAPLSRGVNSFRNSLSEYENAFQDELRTRNAALKEAEAATSRRARKRENTKNMLDYRSALLDITAQIDEISRLKLEFLSDMYGLAAELDEHLVRHLAGLVNAEIEIFDSIARKGWSGGGLDGLLAGCPDPFREADEEEEEEALSEEEYGHAVDSDQQYQQQSLSQQQQQYHSLGGSNSYINRSQQSNTKQENPNGSTPPNNNSGSGIATPERLTPPANPLFTVLANGSSILPSPRPNSDDEAADLTISTRVSDDSD